MSSVDVFPDTDVALISVLAPAFPAWRFATRLPADISEITTRIHRVSGTNRSIRIDRPVVDVDTFGFDDASVSQAAREIQAAILSLRGAIVMNGVIQQAIGIVGPRWLPESNEHLRRYSATYEVYIHAPDPEG